MGANSDDNRKLRRSRSQIQRNAKSEYERYVREHDALLETKLIESKERERSATSRRLEHLKSVS